MNASKRDVCAGCSLFERRRILAVGQPLGIDAGQHDPRVVVRFVKTENLVIGADGQVNVGRRT